MADQLKLRRRRANGEQSRRKILDAAVAVAGERGYDGTSIALVSARCGLPASSIYWHFKDKDDLIAAVIERSFDSWLGAIAIPEGRTARERAVGMSRQVAEALLETPDFLRLGLMLTLEHRPDELRARTIFLSIRDVAHGRIIDVMRALVPELDDESVHLLTTYAVAAADGLFIAKEVGGDGVDLFGLFELHAQLVLDAAVRLTNPKESTDDA